MSIKRVKTQKASLYKKKKTIRRRKKPVNQEIIFPSEDINFPRTVAIAISSHGYIVDGEPVLSLPEDIEFAKMSFVRPSVCSFLGAETVKECNVKIMNMIKNKKTKINTTDIGILCNKITKKLGPILMTSVNDARDVIKDVKLGVDSDDMLTERQAFVDGIDRGIRVFSTSQGCVEMINKRYFRDKVSDALNEYGDWQIKLLNMKGQPDIGRFITGKARQHRGETETTLQEIITFLKSKGSKRIMIFDYSCSNILNEDREDVFQTVRSTMCAARNLESLTRTGVIGHG